MRNQILYIVSSIPAGLRPGLGVGSEAEETRYVQAESMSRAIAIADRLVADRNDGRIPEDAHVLASIRSIGVVHYLDESGGPSDG